MQERKRNLIVVASLIGILGLATLVYTRADQPESPQEPLEQTGADSSTKEVVQANAVPPAATEAVEAPSVGLLTKSGPNRQSEFQTAKQCVFAKRALVKMEKRKEVCAGSEKLEGNMEQEAFYKSCQEDLSRINPAFTLAEKQLESCEVRDLQELEEKFFADTKRAAAMGDANAQVCYLGSRFDLGRAFTPQEIQEYKDSAPRYIEEGISRGDWRIVEVLRRATPSVSRQYALLSQLPSAGPMTMYKMNRLQVLGINSIDYGAYLEVNATGLERKLSDKEKLEANEWASATFERSFKNSAKLSQYPRNCLLEDADYFDANAEF